MKLEIEIPDPPEGCDPAAVQWGVPPKCAWKLVAHMGQWIWRHHEFQTHGETAWVMPYTPQFLGLLDPGWVTYDRFCGWRWCICRPTWRGESWHSPGKQFDLPFRETPLISGKDAIWEVPHD
jgi:hypothetical protein